MSPIPAFLFPLFYISFYFLLSLYTLNFSLAFVITYIFADICLLTFSSLEYKFLEGSGLVGFVHNYILRAETNTWQEYMHKLMKQKF